MLLSLLVSLAAAQPPVDEGAVSPRGDALYDTFLDAFERFDEPSDPRDPLDPLRRWRCNTGVVEALRINWGSLSAEQQARVAGRLSPGRVDPWSESRGEGAPPPVAGDTCWGLQSDNRVAGEHFSVEWNEGVTDEATAQEFLDGLEHGWAVAVDDWGWIPPDGTEEHLLQATIEPGGAGAYTTLRACQGSYIPYIVAGEGSFDSARWAGSMAAHEFLHASQFSYSYAHEFWWWEATATWFEEYSHPEDNVWSESIIGYSLYPHIAMNAFSQTRYDVFAHMYGMAVWAFYLDEYVGGHDLIRETWEYSADKSGSYTLTMEEALTGLGVDFEAAYEGFVAANTVMAYADQDWFLPPNIAETLDELPAGWDVDDGNGQRPETLGQSYVRVDSDAATSELPDLEVGFLGDADREWQVLLVADDNEEVEAVVRVEVIEGAGSATLRDFGDHDYVWLVASPLTGEGGGDYTYAVAAIALPSEDTGDASVDGGEAKGCGCASMGIGGAGGAVGWVGLLVFAAGIRRRRS